MPHVIVKLWPGKTDAQKDLLTDAIVRDVCKTLGYGEDAVSVGFEEVSAKDWDASVFNLDILNKWDTLRKKPGYGSRPKATD
jgi:4-oxalocrotonate tautomerase